MITRKYTDEQANSLAYKIVALFQKEEIFPGCSNLGLNPGTENGKIIADAVYYACLAGKSWSGSGDNSLAYGQLTAMIAYGIANINDIKKAHSKMKSRSLAM